MQAQPRAVDTGTTSRRMIIVWRRWPVVSERFGRLLGTVEVPGEPEKWQPEVVIKDRETGQIVARSASLKLRWDAAGRRYVAPEKFPLGRLTTFQQL